MVEKIDKNIDNMFIQYINKKNKFINKLYNDSVKAVKANILSIDIELIKFSELAFRISNQFSDGDVMIVRWRDFSFELRRMAHKIYRLYGEVHQDSRFLRLIK